MSIAAQEDNLGDIAIRKTIVDEFQSKKYTISVYAGKMSYSHIEVYDLSPNVSVYGNVILFQLALLWSCVRHKTTFVLAPGPFILKDSVGSIIKRLLVVTNMVTVKISGGRIVSLGRSLRGNGFVLGWLERRILDLSSIYTVRDSRSGDIISRELDFSPDVALSDYYAESRRARPYIGISLRYDSDINSRQVGSLIEQCRKQGFTPVLVSQVRRDSGQHKRIAAEFNVDVLLWEESSHSDQLRKVNEMYTQCHAVVSNRLHSLIFGIVAGALPVAWSISTSDKISSTLGPIFPQFCTISASAQYENDFEFLRYGDLHRQKMREALAVARQIIEKNHESI